MNRQTSAIISSPNSYIVEAESRSYKHQYSNIYFVRLQHLRHAVETHAAEKWKNIAGSPVLVPRALDVVKGQVCYVVGTVYIDMPLKPNVLQDISRDQSIPAPPPLDKFHSDDDAIMLEDESGRIRLVGERIKSVPLVTGIIFAVLGTETLNGDFEVVDFCFPEMAPQASRLSSNRQDNITSRDDNWIAIVSGLSVGEDNVNAVEVLVEFICGEAGGQNELVTSTSISRLIIVGNSLSIGGTSAPVDGELDTEEDITEKKPRRYGYDTSTFSPKPVNILSGYLKDLGCSMPVHILPGNGDPSGVILPQQPFPRAMFGPVSSLDTFFCESNPTMMKICPASQVTSQVPSDPASICHLVLHSGQPLSDMFKYVPTPPITRLSLAEMTLRWRHMAPTAPDTLWCHPYFTGDPFILDETPDVYIIGNQPHFATKLVQDAMGDIRCRVVLVPDFATTGQVVLLNTTTLAVKVVKISAEGFQTSVP